jgi:hypothetical protein
MDVSWAIDFFTVTTLRFARLYVFIVLNHSRRKVVHWAITYEFVPTTIAGLYSDSITTFAMGKHCSGFAGCLVSVVGESTDWAGKPAKSPCRRRA